MPGLGDGAFDRDPLARELLDEHGHLRILQVVLLVLGGDQRLGFLGRQPADDHRADERQRNGAAGIDPDLALQVVDAEHLDFDEILRTDPVVVGHDLTRRGRPYARRTWSDRCWSDVDPGLSGVGHRARGDVCGDRCSVSTPKVGLPCPKFARAHASSAQRLRRTSRRTPTPTRRSRWKSAPTRSPTRANEGCGHRDESRQIAEKHR